MMVLAGWAGMSPSLGDGAEGEGEPQHLRLWNYRLDVLIAVVRFGPEDLAAPSVDVGHNVAEALLRDVDRRFDDRFQEHRTRVERGPPKRQRSRDLKGHVVGVD